MTGPAGLTSAEAARRLASEGPNELPRAGRRGLPAILLDVLREPMLLLLLVGGAIYLIFGDHAEAIILLIFASFSILVTTVQESRTERILERLRDLTAPRALVLRDGVPLRIPGREVVRGDVLLVAEGDRVAADGWLAGAQDLRLDESMLTGESVPVGKTSTAAPPVPAPPPGGDGSPMLFAGTLVVGGTGRMVVSATGVHSEIGKIGKSLSQLETEPPRLRAQTMRVVRLAGIAGGAAALLVAVLYGLARGNWLEGALSGIAIGMALLPEEFPVVLTVFLAVGAWRIAQAGVLTRRAAAIESLGAATVLCTDKTGTLTRNQMSVAELDGHVAPFDPAAPAFLDAALVGLLASAPTPFDPMDRAFHDLAGSLGVDTRALLDGLRLQAAFGLRPDLLAVTQVWSRPDGPMIAAAKGAPEAIATLCRMSAQETQALQAQVNAMAARGLRVLGLARADLASPAPPAQARDIAFRFAGLAGLADPLRDSVPAAMADCRAAGIRVVMITGDYPATALSIAAQAGLAPDRVLTGSDLQALTPQDLIRAVADTDIFARVMPDQKLRLVTALKARGEIVAMTGDGVNDAPSLKAAHIGIAMGGRGTDVAREAAAIVLLDDDFGAIVAAIRLGRRIFDNLRKAMSFILALHVPIAGLALLPLVLGRPMLLLPVHIAFLEMIVDPVCTLVFEAEAEEADVMRRPPRNPRAALFSRAMLAWSAVQGAGALAAVAGVYAYGVSQGLPVNELRVLSFFTLVLVILALIFVNRSFSPAPLAALRGGNRTMVLVPTLVAAALALVVLLPQAAGMFGFGPLHGANLGTALGAAMALFAGLELAKAAFRGRLAA